MGITTFPLGFAFWRAWLVLSGGGATGGKLAGDGWLAASAAAFYGVHLLARTSGWSDVVLVTNLLLQLALEWGVLGGWKKVSKRASVASFLLWNKQA